MTDPLQPQAPARAPVADAGLLRFNADRPFVEYVVVDSGKPDDVGGRTFGNWPEATEMRTAFAIRRVLDTGTDRLPSRVTDRLATAREQALARVLETPQPIVAKRPALSLPESGTPISLRWQLSALAVSAVVLAGAFILVDTIREDQSVEDLAEVDSALLTDDLPLDAYVDRGFGVYLVNTRLPQTQAVSFNSRR